MPPAIPGILFLSGGLSEEDASSYLCAINTFPGKKPWALTFGFGRGKKTKSTSILCKCMYFNYVIIYVSALQTTALKTWGGKPDNVKDAQDAFIKRAKIAGDAALGKCSGESNSSISNSNSNNLPPINLSKTATATKTSVTGSKHQSTTTKILNTDLPGKSASSRTAGTSRSGTSESIDVEVDVDEERNGREKVLVIVNEHHTHKQNKKK